MEEGFSATPASADVAYADASDTQKLDIYLPQGAGPFPVVANCHAGGFAFGDKSEVPARVGEALLDAGYAVIGVGYRLSDEATFSAAVLDARAAVRFLRANGDAYRLDPERIAAFGQSAEGNLAAMLGTTGDAAAFDDASLDNADVSNEVQLVIDWFGSTDFGLLDGQAKAQGCSIEAQTYGRPDSIAAAYPGSDNPSAGAGGPRARPLHQPTDILVRGRYRHEPRLATDAHGLRDASALHRDPGRSPPSRIFRDESSLDRRILAIGAIVVAWALVLRYAYKTQALGRYFGYASTP